jgi:ribonuclease BN (tRNA processing enzyme)
MRITVLGKSPSWQDAGGACSGYLIQEDGYTLLLDCGNGVFSKLRRFVDYADVDAVLISHLHADHFLDLVPYSYALRFGSSAAVEPARPPLYAPAGAAETFRRIVGAWGSEDLIEGAFELHEYAAADAPALGPFEIRFCEVPHYTRTFAVDMRSNGSRMTYSADCSPNDELVGFAHATDVLLIEATLRWPEADGDRGHLTPSEAGEHGRRAGAGRLVITHFSDEIDADWARAEAGAAYGGPVELAREGAVYTV